MNSQSVAQPVQFTDYSPVSFGLNSGNNFDIILTGEHTLESYCSALFSKIQSLDLLDFDDFLIYQCEINKNPISWLNSLHRMIKLNTELFNTTELKDRQNNLVSEIMAQRHAIKVASMQNARNKKFKKYLNGFSGDKEYSFEAVLESIKTMETIEEKILFLKEQKKDYQQNPPEFESTLKTKFDKQCDLEINNLIEKEDLIQKANARKALMKQSIQACSCAKPVNIETKSLCYLFVQARQKKVKNGKFMIEWSAKETVDFICNNFCESDGTPFNPSTIRTYLSPGRYDARPKGADEINLDNLLSD